VVKVFLWKACNNILPTKHSLHKKGVTEDSLCPLCGLEDETTEHIIWNCQSAQDVWVVSSPTIQKCPKMEVAFHNILLYLSSRLSEENMQLVVVTARLLWLQRNTVVHGGDLTSPIQVMELARSQLENYRKAESGRRMTSPPTVVTVPLKWTTPQEGFIKLNWDVALDTQHQRMGIGVIA
jgi:hypothetical protein